MTELNVGHSGGNDLTFHVDWFLEGETMKRLSIGARGVLPLAAALLFSCGDQQTENRRTGSGTDSDDSIGVQGDSSDEGQTDTETVVLNRSPGEQAVGTIVVKLGGNIDEKGGLSLTRSPSPKTDLTGWLVGQALTLGTIRTPRERDRSCFALHIYAD